MKLGVTLCAFALLLGSCAGDDAAKPWPCASTSFGCDCSATTTDDGVWCAAHYFPNGYCCKSDSECACLQPECYVQTSFSWDPVLSQRCYCSHKGMALYGDTVVTSCPAIATQHCCLSPVLGTAGGFCRCTEGGCDQGLVEVSSCSETDTMYCGLADEELVDACN